MSEGRFQIGALEITKVPETELTILSPESLFPAGGFVAEHFPPHMNAPDGTVRLASHSWLVRGPFGTALIDTGIGDDKPRPMSPPFHALRTGFLDNLATLGVAPGDVDLVLHTHLHVDHVGWNTVLHEGVWLPVFTNARHVICETEYRFFADPANFSARTRNSFLARQDSVDPIVAAGMAELFGAEGGEVRPGIRFLPTPGHSPFHFAIEIEAGGATAFFIGDTMHHVAQVARPEVNAVFDADPDRACISRRCMLEHAADRDLPVFGAHIAGSSALRITREGDGFAWEELFPDM